MSLVLAVIVSLAADHRVSDGRRGALFLAEIDRLLQEPEKLMTQGPIASRLCCRPDCQSRPISIPRQLQDDDHLQDDLGLDSMDFLNLVSALHKRFGLPIPEADYPRLATPGKAVGYLQEVTPA